MTAHEKQATMIVTDQDRAMKLAIEEVLTESKHRLCMWHIMQKIPAKICKEIYDEKDFKERFNKVVWNMFMEPMEFEEKWSKLIEDFGLQNHKWMTKISESENAFFKSFTNHGSTLVNFMMCFESAMERQRYRQEVLDFRTFDSAPKLHTKLKIEIHASKVRDKRVAAYKTLNKETGKEVVQEKEYVAEYKVLRSLEDDSMECTCRHFLRYKFLCRRVFYVLKNRDIQVIPKKYILRRWRRDIIPPALRRNTNRYGEKNGTITKLTNEANFVAVNKGGRRGEHRKSGREIALKSKTRQIHKCLCCREKTNKHTKSTCPSNPKYVSKLARLVAAAAEQGTTTAATTEQATTTATAAEQGTTTAATTEQATTTATAAEQGTTIAVATEQATITTIVSEEATNAS
ncbi:FAR1-related sequence 5-like protein [Tanacetum coccineum]